MARGLTKDGIATLEERPPSALDAVTRAPSPAVNGSATIRRGDEVFGRLVAVRRAALGLSQEALAARMEASQASVAGIESGRSPTLETPTLETLERLASALDAEPRTGPAWRTLAGRWRWGGLAIAVLVPAVVILNGRAGDPDRASSSEDPPGRNPRRRPLRHLWSE